MENAHIEFTISAYTDLWVLNLPSFPRASTYSIRNWEALTWALVDAHSGCMIKALNSRLVSGLLWYVNSFEHSSGLPVSTRSRPMAANPLLRWSICASRCWTTSAYISPCSRSFLHLGVMRRVRGHPELLMIASYSGLSNSSLMASCVSALSSYMYKST